MPSKAQLERSQETIPHPDILPRPMSKQEKLIKKANPSSITVTFKKKKKIKNFLDVF